MLIQFNFKNYKSFRDEATLDMTAMPNIKAFADRVVSIGKDKILPVASIYGANASGKSNVYGAFRYMTNFVADSFIYGGDTEAYRKRLLPPTFLFDSSSEDAESTFEVFFSYPGEESIYNYGFAVNQNGVAEEWLNKKEITDKEYKTVIYRTPKELDLPMYSKSVQKNLSIALEDEVLVVSLGAKLKIEVCKKVRDWFLLNKFTDFANTIENLYLFNRLPRNFGEDKNVQKEVIDYLATFDNQILDFKVEQVVNEEKGEEIRKSYEISALHKKIGSHAKAEISLRDESAGTLKMFALYPDLQSVLQNGSVFFIDELNARLHPLLVRNFLLTFLNPKINKNHAQLIFTTHDTWQMSERLLRKDEIWFAEKDKDGLSSLYSLADFKDVDDNDIEEDYLLGRYGAIPFLKSIKIAGEEHE